MKKKMKGNYISEKMLIKKNEPKIKINKNAIIKGRSLMNANKIKYLIYWNKEIPEKSKRKSSFDFTSKDLLKKELDGNRNIKRKSTIENVSVRLIFAPKIKPIKSGISPSKLQLNNQLFSFNENKNMKKSISLPDDSQSNSSNGSLVILMEEEDHFKFDEYEYMRKESIHDTRKILSQTRNSNQNKSNSAKNLFNRKKFVCKCHIEINSDSDLEFNENDNDLDLVKDPNDNNNKKNIYNIRNRNHSCSILYFLKKRFELEK